MVRLFSETSEAVRTTRRKTFESVLESIGGLEALATETRLRASREGDRPTMEWARGYLQGLESLRNIINEEIAG